MAEQNGYKASLFKRLFQYFGGEFIERSPVHRLLTQYRMHPEIAEWPNKYIYGGDLENGSQDRSSNLVPFKVFDTRLCYTVEESKNNSIKNAKEVKIVANLIQRIRNVHPKLSLGVITFYNLQRWEIS